MNWLEPDEALSDLPPGTRFVSGNVSGTPHTLLGALARRAEVAGNLTLISGLLLGDIPLERAIRSGNLTVRSWHIHGSLRGLYREGLVDYMPVRLLDIPDTVLAHSDVALLRVGPPDADGNCSVGPSASYTREAAERVGLVIAEVTDEMPRLRGDGVIHASQIDRFVRSATPLPVHEPSSTTDTSRAIAQNVIGLLPDGATLQLGIGAVPESIARELADDPRGDSIGLLGLITDAAMPLVDRIGQPDGTAAAVELMGTAELMRWANDHPAIELADSQQVHNPARLADIPRLVSVNSAVAVDLMGQVIAESVGGSVIAGVGGSADFAEGAHLSPGGIRVVALAATTRAGTSTIVRTHDSADSVTTPHHGVDAVVTEHGIARLSGATRRERREALVSIAAPEHRVTLRESAPLR